jgi:hypothetical protein
MSAHTAGRKFGWAFFYHRDFFNASISAENSVPYIHLGQSPVEISTRVSNPRIHQYESCVSNLIVIALFEGIRMNHLKYANEWNR